MSLPSGASGAPPPTLRAPHQAVRFPPGFAWGVATAATQIEGAADLDGKGASIWDVFARRPGVIAGGDTPAVACDHYHRYEHDLDLLAGLGLKHYRLSLAWPRLLPDGVGHVNARGIDFYQRLIDAILARGITPWVTLFHWDLPQALEAQGGWVTRAVVDAFADYADLVVRTYGDRVKRWITLNEIGVFIDNGYALGRHAPGRTEKPDRVLQALHHALVCHGHAVRAVREHGGRGAQVGLTENSSVPLPLMETSGDIAAAEAEFARRHCRVLGPVLRGEYDDLYRAHTRGWMPRIESTDFALIAQPTDFLGLNLYSGSCVTTGTDGRPRTLPYPEHYPVADSPWLKLNARCLYWGPRLAAAVYGVRRIAITENGAGYDEVPPVRGEISDLHRLEYVRACLRELKRAIDDGVPVEAYFLWSLLDNFEWAEGNSRRFGIVHNDFTTQVRTPKISAKWFSAVVRENAVI